MTETVQKGEQDAAKNQPQTEAEDIEMTERKRMDSIFTRPIERNPNDKRPERSSFAEKMLSLKYARVREQYRKEDICKGIGLMACVMTVAIALVWLCGYLILSISGENACWVSYETG